MTMNKISRAYDVLSNPSSKSEYDNSSKILVSLKSKAVSIHINNFNDLIFKSNSPWLIMVYDSNN